MGLLFHRFLAGFAGGFFARTRTFWKVEKGMDNASRNELLNREIGRRVWELRELFGMSRDEPAERLGLTVPHMGLIERGQRGLTPARCIAISDIFCVSVEYIFASLTQSIRTAI